MLYGANGYTGELLAEEAVRRGMRPLLAGRREERLRPLAERLGLEHRAFSLDDIGRHLDGCALVLLAAGPFSATSRPVVDACLRAGVSYLDITGELEVFEAVLARDDIARRAGSVLLPGIGFDVVPSDCLAASLKHALPAADRLELAFASAGGPSAGTAKTIVESLPRGGAIRRDGSIVRVPTAWKTMTIAFRDRPRIAVSIPWGDVSTAYHSTGIPNVVVFMAMPPGQIRALRLLRPFARLAGLGPVQSLLTAFIEKAVHGPDAERRRIGRSQVWGRVTSPSGATAEGTLETPDGYELTAGAGIEIARRVLDGAVEAGAYTPSKAFGAAFVTELDGCDLRIDASDPS